jgi:hypothetical protein
MMINPRLIVEVTKELDDPDLSISDTLVIIEYFIKDSKENGSSIDDVYQAFYLAADSVMSKLLKYDSETLDCLRFILKNWP